MRRTAYSLLLAASNVAALTGCGAPEPPRETVQQTATPIYGGSVDTAHDAVVFLYANAGYACSGTIIATNGSSGYVLTAAHCDGMDYVIMADNLSCLNNSSCAGIWQIAQQTVHPSYTGDVGDGYDFSLIRFIGANASTPVIAAASTPDGAAAGANIDLVGYGVTEFGDTDNRMHVVMPIDGVDGLFVAVDQTGGEGTCSGDSGGPGILGGKVVSVTSFGDNGCNEYGVGGRVQTVYNSYIAPFIGATPPALTCDECLQVSTLPGGACGAATDACFANSSCSSLVECLDPCTTQACVDSCANQYSSTTRSSIASATAAVPPNAAANRGASLPRPRARARGRPWRAPARSGAPPRPVPPRRW
jgi:hypothetical protein